MGCSVSGGKINGETGRQQGRGRRHTGWGRGGGSGEIDLHDRRTCHARHLPIDDSFERVC